VTSIAASPEDHAARTAIREDHSRSMVVEAGAGTGKTTALVSRIIALVAQGREICHIAAITFSEAAAAELRDRVRYALEEAVAGSDDQVTSDTGRTRCHDALEHLDDASISTLHGFAQRILASYPMEAGLPPQFEVLDGIESAMELEGRWAELESSLLEDPSIETDLLCAQALGIELDTMRSIAFALHGGLDRIGGADFPPRPFPDLSAGVTAVVAALDAAVDRVGECTAPDDDKLALHLKGLVPYRDSLRSAVERAGGDRSVDVTIDILELLAEGPALHCARGQKGNWPDVVAVRTRCESARGARDRLLLSARQALLHTFVHRAVEFVRDYAAWRRTEGRLGFQDLLILAVDVLRTVPSVLEATRDRHRYVLVDEFQDTDPLQVDLAVLLASSDPDAGAKAAAEIEIDAGRLFLVGDPKQSIYRFRRADLAVYAAAAARPDLSQLTLTRSFRSVPGLLDFVNRVFGILLADGEPGVQAAPVELTPSRAASCGCPVPVRIVGEPHEGNIGLIREREASEIAAVITRIKADRWQVREANAALRGVDAFRDAKFGDVAILLPTRTTLDGIEAALEQAGIPVRIESQSLVFATAEVHDILAALTAIDDPSDEVALVGALRSPTFGCSDSDLIDYYEAGGRWSYLARLPAGVSDAQPVASAMASLRGLHEQRSWRSVSETLDALVTERRLLALALAHLRPRDHWRRIRFLADQARSFDDRGHTGLRNFVSWVRHRADEKARASEVIVPEADDDAVRILTVHGAKGLEFPIVVLAGLNSRPHPYAPAVLWSEGGPEFSISRRKGHEVCTAGYDDARERERVHSAAEEVRLLYVAATRACDHLVVSVHRKDDHCLAGRLADALAAATCEVLDIGDAVSVRGETSAPLPTLTLSERDERLAARADLLAQAARPAAVAATTLAKSALISGQAATGDEGGGYPGLDKNDVDLSEDPPPWRRGRAGTAVGRAVHAVLQTADLTAGEDLTSAARTQAVAEGVPARADEVRLLAENVLASPIVRFAASEGRYWREVPVAAVIDDQVLEGFIDLLVETPDGLVVVDYKTDQVGDQAEVERAMARYSVQGAAYAVAITEGTGLAVSRCVFVFAQRSGAIEREVPDLPAIMQKAREVLASAPRRGSAPARGPG